MKYIVVLADGMADEPIDSLGNKTPMAYAKTPHFDFMAKNSELGMAKTVPEGYPPGSDVANLSVLGYDPCLYYTGRSPLEALSMGVDLDPEDVAFRANLVTLSDEAAYDMKTMIDYSSDEIPTEESRVLMEEISARLSSRNIKFYPGISYRHLMVWHRGPTDAVLTPPHDISDQPVSEYLPKGNSADTLLCLMRRSHEFLPENPVNISRVKRGLRPANSLWLWGQGKKPAVPSFLDKYGLSGSVISAVDLTNGLGIAAGLRSIKVEGATGNLHTNFVGKAEAALEELRQGQDFIYIHVEAPDECGHRGELENKIKAIEEIDEKVVGTLLAGLAEFDDYRILLMPDHPTPMRVRTHVSDPVPYLIYQKSAPVAGTERFTEETASASGRYYPEAHRLMDHFIKDIMMP